MTSGRISRLSAALLLGGGLLFLFEPAAMLSQLSPGFPADAAWLGQLIGAGWLGLGMLDWQSRHRILGGIYGRPVLTANLMFFWVGGTLLLDAARSAGAPRTLWVLAAPAMGLALVYAWLMLRGPLQADRRSGRQP